MPRARKAAASLRRIASGPRSSNDPGGGWAVGRGGVGARRSFGAALADREPGSAESIRMPAGTALSFSRASACPRADGGRAGGSSGAGCVTAVSSGTLLRLRSPVGAALGGIVSGDSSDQISLARLGGARASTLEGARELSVIVASGASDLGGCVEDEDGGPRFEYLRPGGPGGYQVYACGVRRSLVSCDRPRLAAGAPLWRRNQRPEPPEGHRHRLRGRRRAGVPLGTDTRRELRLVRTPTSNGRHRSFQLSYQ